MASINKCILLGNLTHDPEIKTTPSGVSVCNFSIAVNRPFAKEGQIDVDFINVVAWEKRAEFVASYFTKGEPILVCGSLQIKSWDDNGTKRYSPEIVAEDVSFVKPKGKEE